MAQFDLTDRRGARVVRLAALGGLAGPLLLGGALGVLTVVQYEFLRGLRWHPLHAPTTDWPSGLALGPYGAWMTAAFVVCGGLQVAFGGALRHVLAGNRPGRLGALLLAAAGAAIIGLSAPTDPTFGGGPATLAGRLHDLSFVALGLTLMPALVLLALGFQHDRRWAGLAGYTALTAALVVPAFVFKGLLFYGFLLAVLAWFEVVAARLWQVPVQGVQLSGSGKADN